MRQEIKFRAFVDDEQMCEVITIYTNTKEAVCLLVNEIPLDDADEQYHKEITAVEIPLKNLKLMQFTGLRDCRFYDIYEGDILEVGGVRGVVVFLEGCFVFLEDHETSMLLYETDASVECFCPISLLDKKGCVSIVGNIFQNKDLLKWVNLTTKNTR